MSRDVTTIVTGGGRVVKLELLNGRVKITTEGGLSFDAVRSDTPALGAHVSVRATYQVEDDK